MYAGNNVADTDYSLYFQGTPADYISITHGQSSNQWKILNFFFREIIIQI